MKCGKKAYPLKLNKNRLYRLLQNNIQICFCEKSVTNTLMGNEEIKLEKDLANLKLEKKRIELQIEKKKKELKNHKNTINFKKIKCYLNKKLNTMKHGRQKSM